MRYLFCSSSSVGLLGPSITIAQQMQYRGHEVAFVTGQSMIPLLRQAGLERIPYGTQDGESFDAKSIWKVPDALRQVRHTEYACKQFAPDVLVGQSVAWGAIAVGNRYRLPLAVIGQAGYIWPTEPPLPYYMIHNPAFYNHVYERYTRALNMYKVCSRALNMTYEEVPYSQTPLLGDMFLLQSVPALEGGPALLPEKVHLIGDCTWNPCQINDELQQWLEEAQAANIPVVYVQIGRVLQSSDYVHDLIEVLGKQPVRVVASFGGASNSIASLPENFFVHERILQGQVLPFARAVICSGTTTSVLGAVTHGVPLLIIPANSEEPNDMAVRCMDAGIGLCLDPQDATYEAFQQKIATLLEQTSLLTNARRIQQAFAKADGPATAADLLTVLGQEHSSSAREVAQYSLASTA